MWTALISVMQFQYDMKLKVMLSFALVRICFHFSWIISPFVLLVYMSLFFTRRGRSWKSLCHSKQSYIAGVLSFSFYFVRSLFTSRWCENTDVTLHEFLPLVRSSFLSVIFFMMFHWCKSLWNEFRSKYSISSKLREWFSPKHKHPRFYVCLHLSQFRAWMGVINS